MNISDQAFRRALTRRGQQRHILAASSLPCVGAADFGAVGHQTKGGIIRDVVQESGERFLGGRHAGFPVHVLGQHRP